MISLIVGMTLVAQAEIKLNKEYTVKLRPDEDKEFYFTNYKNYERHFRFELTYNGDKEDVFFDYEDLLTGSNWEFIKHKKGISYYEVTCDAEEGYNSIEFSIGNLCEDKNIVVKFKLIEDTQIEIKNRDKNKISIKYGEQRQLKYSIYSDLPDYDTQVIFKSSNKKVANVNSEGLITGKGIGKATISAKLKYGNTIKWTVIVKENPYLNVTNLKLEEGDTYKLKVYGTNKKIRWSSSNSKIAKVSDTGIVTGNGLGSCIINAKVGSKSYKSKIKIISPILDFTAYIDDYDTRNNCFLVEIKNYSHKPLTIHSSNAKACEKHYKSYDRNLYLSTGNVVIQPGKKKTIKFKVRGRITWYDERDFWIQYYFTFDGKRYFGKTYTDDTLYQKGKKFVKTYPPE